MSARIVLPAIAEADFASFRSLLPIALPSSYAEHTKLVWDWRREYPDAVFVPVCPKNFAEFLADDDMARPRDLASLLSFAGLVARAR
jgi:hypothetical protein